MPLTIRFRSLINHRMDKMPHACIPDRLHFRFCTQPTPTTTCSATCVPCDRIAISYGEKNGCMLITSLPTLSVAAHASTKTWPRCPISTHPKQLYRLPSKLEAENVLLEKLNPRRLETSVTGFTSKCLIHRAMWPCEVTFQLANSFTAHEN